MRKALYVYIVVSFLLSMWVPFARAMDGVDYKIQFDSIGSGGDEASTSSNYGIYDTLGDQGVGISTTTHYQNFAGYRFGMNATNTISQNQNNNNNNNNNNNVIPQQLTILDVKVTSVTKNSATITWTTNVVGDSRVAFGLDWTYASGTVAQSSMVLSHVITLSKLDHDTTYHFAVRSKATGGDIVSSADYTFTTTDGTPPVISNVAAAKISDVSADISWDTNEGATTQISYGTSTKYGASVQDGAFVTSHVAHLVGLQPGTAYHFFLTATDSAANTATTTDLMFTTGADKTPPPNVLVLTAKGGDAIVHLTWLNPKSIDFVGVVIVRRTDGLPKNASDGELVYKGGAQAMDDVKVVNGKTYYYGAFAYDAFDNFASGALASATPEAINNNNNNQPPIPPKQDEPLKLGGGGKVVEQVPPPKDLKPQPEQATTSQAVPDAVKLQRVFLPHFYIQQGAFELVPDIKQRVRIEAGKEMLVRVYRSDLGEFAERIVVNVGGSSYLMALNQGETEYDAVIEAPAAGLYLLQAQVLFADKTVLSREYQLESQLPGLVTEADGAAKPIAGAIVTLYVEGSGPWNAALYGQSNPIATNVNGRYAFTVPAGSYYVVVEKKGYKKVVTSPFTLPTGLFAEQILLPLLPATSTAATSTPEMGESSASSANAGISTRPIPENSKLPKSIAEVVQLIQSIPPVPEEVKRNVEVAVAPATVAVGVTAAASTFSVFNALAYLRFLFTQPLFLIGRRKRKWGVVYNSLSKQPIDLAIVRLLRADTGVLVQTRVTDRAGRFAFLAKPGTYILQVVKPQYVYPTAYLKDRKQDGDFAELYHGQTIDIREGDVIANDVPIDPIVPVETPKKILMKNRLRKIQAGAATASIGLALVSFVVVPGWSTGVMLAFQGVSYLLFHRLGRPMKAKQWGAVRDAASKKPLARTVMRIFDTEFNKLLETQITDANGGYGFFAKQNVYYITAECEGYEKYQSEQLDLRKKEETVVAKDISLKTASF